MYYPSPISLEVLQQHEPKVDWFIYQSQLHGVAHSTRVLILQELLGQILLGSGEAFSQEAVRLAASRHDTRRLNDGLDLEHGKRAGNWMERELKGLVSLDALMKAAHAASWHVAPDQEIGEMTQELKILKDADALDRVRLGDFDQRYLRFSQSSLLIPTASALYKLSEKQPNIRIRPFEAVVAAGRQLNVISRAN